jgi:hypothetical protein
MGYECSPVPDVVTRKHYGEKCFLPIGHLDRGDLMTPEQQLAAKLAELARDQMEGSPTGRMWQSALLQEGTEKNTAFASLSRLPAANSPAG